jgi:hypothetical protein
VAEAGIGTPFLVLPLSLSDERWLLPVYGHPSSEAHARHAELVYDLIGQTLGWPARGASGVGVQQRPQADWARAIEPVLRDMTRTQLAEAWAAPAKQQACVGVGIDCATGVLSRGGTILLRKQGGATWLDVTVQRLDEIPSAYPMRVRVQVPSAGGGSEADAELRGDGPAELVLGLPLPADIPDGRAIDVVILAERAEATAGSLLGRSLRVLAVSQR